MEACLWELDEITGAIVDESLKIHQGLGPGLLESVYEAVLARALERRGFRVERQKLIRFEFDGMLFEEGFRIDLLVEGLVVVELKSVEALAPVYGKQVLTYLRLTGLQVGLLINLRSRNLEGGPPPYRQPLAGGRIARFADKPESGREAHSVTRRRGERGVGKGRLG